MKENRIEELQKQGQRIWLDNINRGLITSGALQKLIREGVTGVTSNPTIFEKAIGGGDGYDDEIRRFASEGKEAPEIIELLMIRDIQAAADLFRPVYEEAGGNDGFVSIELNPELAHRTEETIEAAKALHPRLDRKNVMIKVPATEEGLPAIEALTEAGLSINITLLFSLEGHEKVAKAYLSGIKKRIEGGRPAASIRSVASVFVSRIDTAVDRLLEARIEAARTEGERSALRSLLGKGGIANSKMIYQKFKEIFTGAGAPESGREEIPIQKVLWGSTGTKNPKYRDLLYVEELIGPNTINTLPPATLAAFEDHGKVRPSLEEDLEGARSVLQKLERLEIDLLETTRAVQEEGVRAFAASYQKLIASVDAKRRKALARKTA